MVDVFLFKCSEEHVFFMPLKLPIDAMELIDALDGLACPICRGEHIKVDPRVKRVTCIGDSD